MFRSVCYVFIFVLLVGSVTAQQPSAEQLLERWVSWEKSMHRLPPHRMKKEFYNAASLRDSGIEKAVSEGWYSEEYLCNESETIFPSDSAGRSQMRYVVAFLDPDRFTALGRNRLEDPWRITRSGKPLPRRNLFGNLVDMAEAISRRKTPLQAKATSSPDGFPVLRIEFSPPAQYKISGVVPVDMPQVEVTFGGNDQELVPTRIDQKLVVDGDTQWVRSTAEDYIDFAGTKVPLLYQRFFTTDDGKEEVSFQRIESLKISELEEVPLEEIQKRCEFAFWQLPEQRETGRFAYRRFLITLLIFVSGLIYGVMRWRAKRTARAV